MCMARLLVVYTGSADDKMAVTDPECRVYGLESLRIVDASIMPKVITGNLNGKYGRMSARFRTLCAIHAGILDGFR